MRIKLVYPAQPFFKTEIPKPDGSLGLIYIAGALRNAGHDVSLLDMCVGEDEFPAERAFFNRTEIDDELVRVGLSLDDFASKIEGYDVVATTSIFTMNTKQAFEVGHIAKQVNPNTLTIAGGGNARALHPLFLDNGFDVVVFGEAEETIVELCEAHEDGRDFSTVDGVAFRDPNGEIIITKARPAPTDLDALPLPAWDLLPLQKYWDLGDPPGGAFDPNQHMRYLTMQTSRGCPFKCAYCHISKQGDAARLRLKSDDRVFEEMQIIQNLGAEHVFIQDDSFLAKRSRVLNIFELMKKTTMRFYDFNGVNIRHLFQGTAVEPTLDLELLDAMKESGMKHLSLAFESGSPRIIKKYSTNKWDARRHDTLSMIRELTDRGFSTEGYFTIGYPDETLEELSATFLFAQKLVDAGLGYASFYIVTPYPDNTLFDMAQRDGHLPEKLDWSRMKFQVPTMVNTIISQDVLQYSRQIAYRLIHSTEKFDVKTNKTVALAS